MVFLESVIAFAVVMIIMATIVSGVVEVIGRALAIRSTVLTEMVTQLLRVELEKRLLAGGPVDGKHVDQAVSALTMNPLEPGKKHKVDALSVWAFMQRLAGTRLGEQILERGEAEAQVILVHLSRAFERYAAASQEVFRKRLNRIALLVAMVAAPALNIDAPRLLNHLISNAESRAALIAAGEAAGEANAAQERRLAEAVAALEKAPDDAAAAGALKDAAAALSSNMANFAKMAPDLDLPILYDHFPFGPNGWPKHSPTAAEPGKFVEVFSWAFLGAFLAWIIGVALGGVLIGLGGPFWFRVFDSLTQLLQALRGPTGKSREMAMNPADEKIAIVGDPAADFDTPAMVRTFRIAAGKYPDATLPPCG